MNYLTVTANNTAASFRAWVLPARAAQRRTDYTELDPRCCACGQRGPGLTATRDGRPVHRWPCLDRLRE